MTNTALPKRVKISDSVLFQEISGEGVLLNMESEQYFGLDEIGARFWQLLSTSGGDTAAALESLHAEYAVERETLRADLANLVDHLKKENLLIVEQ